jgi:hypothetical protein
MTEHLSKLQDLFTRIEAELPDHLRVHVTLEADENKDCINIVFKDMGALGKENFKQLRSILEENYCADFTNPAFPQQPYYAVKQKRAVALPSEDSIGQALRGSLIKKAQALNLGIPDADLQSMPLSKLEALVKVATKVSSAAEQAKPSVDAKPAEVPKAPSAKQASPLQMLKARFCELCEDNGTDKCNFELCLRILTLFEAQSQTDVLEKINRSLDNVQRQISQIPVASQPAHAADPAGAAPPIQNVERSTRPAEGHREGDVVWIWAENQKGERYEKALETDNARSDAYFELRGKKGLELGGKWLWLSDRDDYYIGRKAAKQFPKGDRR